MSSSSGDVDNDQATNTSSSSSREEVRKRHEASENAERIEDEQSGDIEDIVIHPQVQEFPAYNNNIVHAEADALAPIVPESKEGDEIPKLPTRHVI